MQKVVFKELWLLSKKEETARKISFNPSTTVILGVNDTGKSSLIKSIYYTLGADIHFDKGWEDANVISLLRFSIGNTEYLILRYQRLFGIYDANGELIEVSQGITKGIGKYLNQLFDFNLKLKPGGSKPYEPATPVFQYLPYYIDQDKGWLKPWSSFERLQQFSGWQKDVISYHSGIRPKEYYDISEILSNLESSLKEKTEEKDVIQIAQKRIEEKQKKVLFNVDLDDYKKVVDELLERCNTLNNEQELFRNKLLDAKNKEIIFQNQFEIAKKSLNELENDYEFTLKNLDSENVECPTCGSHFDNSLIFRFSLVEDSETCRELVIELDKELSDVKLKIAKLEKEYLQKTNDYKSVQNLLLEKKGQIKLYDLIKSESQKEIHNTFSENLTKYEEEITALNFGISKNKTERQKYLDKDRTKEIYETFSSHMSIFLPSLEVYGLKEEDYSSIPSSIKQTGSDHPRALLAYYFSFLYTIRNHSSSLVFPVIIDSPNQQDQDDKNLKKIMEFALSKLPGNFQLILGSVDLYGAEYNGYKIIFDDKYCLLQKEEYSTVNSFVTSLLNKALDHLQYGDEER